MTEDRGTKASEVNYGTLVSGSLSSNSQRSEHRKVLGTGGGYPIGMGSGDQGAKPMVEQKGDFKPSNEG